MYGRENICAATGSGPVEVEAFDTDVVDTEFWALILDDEDWLTAEFTAIVSEPCEARLRTSGRPSVEAAPAGGSSTLAVAQGPRQGWRTGRLPGRRWRRERSPPTTMI